MLKQYTEINIWQLHQRKRLDALNFFLFSPIISWEMFFMFYESYFIELNDHLSVLTEF